MRRVINTCCLLFTVNAKKYVNCNETKTQKVGMIFYKKNERLANVVFLFINLFLASVELLSYPANKEQ